MKLKTLFLPLTFVVTLSVCGFAFAMDEAVLTATNNTAVAAENKEFNSAMAVWFKHRYVDGEKMLRDFSSKHPDSRWAAEADMHVGCYLTYTEQYNEARSIFNRLVEKHAGNAIAAKAKLRLGNIAERTANIDEAIRYYGDVLQMAPDWDQFRYANYRARKLAMTKEKRLSRINCGPVALSACLKALGKTIEAEAARSIKPTEDGMSLAMLEAEAKKIGIDAQPVEMSKEGLRSAVLPIIAHVQPNHFVAVLSIKDNQVELEDSIVGRREIPLRVFEESYTGKALAFSADAKLKPLSIVAALEAVGGCCGKADEDECLGYGCHCQQHMEGPGCCCDSGRGSPTWQVNTANLNILVTDTPIWYDPGKGPEIQFELTYSNENSNTGIFGRGWRSPYDVKVFFLPSDTGNLTLQLHCADGRIETYVWDGDSYEPREYASSYGYRNDTIVKEVDGTVILSLREGGKLYFMPEGGLAEGRIHFIEDQVGNRVTCEYDPNTGNLTAVKDANNRTTTITTTGSGITERVTRIDLPQDDSRYAEFGYDGNGNLTSIEDMLGATSYLTYNAVAWWGDVPYPASLQEDITSSYPPNGGSLWVDNAILFPPSGTIEVNDAEQMTYTSKTGNYFHGIARGNPALSALKNSEVAAVSVGTQVPYLSTIETPSKKTMFTYEWWRYSGLERPLVAVHEVYECGHDEQYPTVPALHFAWCSTWHGMKITRHPTSVTNGVNGCDSSQSHWTGGLTKTFGLETETYDSTGSTYDEYGRRTAYYEYNLYKDLISALDANNNPTYYYYGWDGEHNLYSVTDALYNTREFTYYSNHGAEKEMDVDGNVVKAYTYNAAGQITKIETELTSGVRSILAENVYDGNGRLVESYDGGGIAAGRKTEYHYNENGETRGFLTSVHDPDNKATLYTYDSKGRRDTVTDARGKTTTYEYDDLDRVTKVTNPDDTFVERHYTCCHVDWEQDENDRRVYYLFDIKNRPYKEVASAKSTTLAQDITPEFPADSGNLSVTSVADLPSSGSVVVLDEIISYTGKDTGNNQLTGVTRGAQGTRKVEADSGYAVGRVDTVLATYGYDTQFPYRKIKVTDANGHDTNYEYYDTEDLKKITYADGTWEQNTYDPVGNLIKKEYGHDSTVTKTVNYVYDANNRLIGS